MTDLSPASLEHTQSEVFVLIGKCVLNLQLYEQALKNLLPAFEVSSDGPTPEQKREKLAKLPLGSLIRLLLDHTAEFDEEAEDPKPFAGSNVAFRSRFRLPVNAEGAEQLCKDLAELLLKRNFLIHHFRSEYDLKTESGCLAAKAYLEDLNQQAKSAIEQKDEIAKRLKSSAELLSRFLASDEAMQIIEEGLQREGFCRK